VSAEVRLFGTVSLVIGERAFGPRDFGGRKSKQVLEILALGENRYVSKDYLTALLWNENPPQDSEGCLEHYVSLLRRQLRVTRDPGPSIILTEHGGYRLDAEHVWVDVAAFNAIDRACADSDDRSLLESALALMRGDLLEDEPYADWAVKARDHYRQRQLRLLGSAGEIALRERDFDAAVACAREAAAIDALNESSHRCLMLAHYARGERAAALRVFADLSRALVEEVGVDAMRATTTLHIAILNEVPVDELLPIRHAPSIDLSPGHPKRTPDPAPDKIAYLGRHAPHNALLALCTDIPVGPCCHPVVAVVEGGTGIGKSRFIDEAAMQTPGCDVPVVRCAPGMRHVRGALVEAIFAALSGGHAKNAMRGSGFSTAVQDDSVSLTALREVEQCLARSERFIVMIDDAHWADAFSLRLLSYLTHRNQGVSGAFVLALNEDELRPEHSQVLLRAACRIQLGSLSAEDLEPLAIDDLYAKTGGLPVAVVAHVQAGTGQVAADIPDSYRGTVLARIHALGEIAWRVAVASAVTEPPCSPGEVSALLGTDPLEVVEAQDRLCRIGVLQPAADGFVFRYPLLRTLLRDTMSPARLRRLEQFRARPAASQEAQYERFLPVRLTAASTSSSPTWASVPVIRPARGAATSTAGA
jgi:DNA-binding SARP family transcriptional activator